MASVVLMPKVGISVESCIITEWVKKPGDTVAVGDILFSYETDKSSMECESTEAGVLLEQFYANGDEVDVLTAVCAIGKAGEDVGALRPGGAGVPAPAADVQQAPAAAPAPEAPAAVSPAPVGQTDSATGALKISPRARNLAAQRSIDVQYAQGSGPYGRVIERDVRTLMDEGRGVMTAAAYATGAFGKAEGTGLGGRVTARDLLAGSAGATPITTLEPMSDAPAYKDITFTGIRKAISKSMSASLATIPQLTHNFSFDASNIMAYRAMLKKNADAMELPDITLNDFVLFAVSRTLGAYPQLNAHMLDATSIRQFSEVHLGMAVDTPRGLMVPVIKNANRKSLSQIATECKSLARQAQEGSINPDDLSGATFTVSNLGALGVESFTPVINPPQTGILGVDNIIKRVREGKDGAVEMYPAMGISLTYDHRAIDGAPASRFASGLCRTLENFTLLLAR